MNSDQPIKVACILDEFSELSFTTNFLLCQLTPSGYIQELKDFKPDFVWVESAWRGKDGLWFNQLINGTQALHSLLQYCKFAGYPTIFWNKEDPVYFDAFTQRSAIAQQFDVVCTTEFDMLPKYRALLQHERVYWLPFSVNLRQHHPLQLQPRKPGFCFAGSYYPQFPDRCADFDNVLDALCKLGMPGDIFDRNFNDMSSSHQFPLRYQAMIRGKLAYQDIEQAYKGYQYGVTINTVTVGQTMFARRALELIACNTRVVSNYSRALRLLFGAGTCVMPESSWNLSDMVTLNEPESLNASKTKAALFYKVAEYYSTDYWARKLCHFAGLPFGRIRPLVLIVGRATDTAGKQRISTMVALQQYPSLNCVWEEQLPATDLALYSHYCLFDENCWYSPEYIQHMLLYSNVYPENIICKPVLDQQTLLRHRPVNIQSGVFHQQAWFCTKLMFTPQLLSMRTGDSMSLAVIVDPFDFWADLDSLVAVQQNLDLSGTNTGRSVAQIESAASDEEPVRLYSEMTAAVFFIPGRLSSTPDVTVSYDPVLGSLKLESTLAADVHCYLNFPNDLSAAALGSDYLSLIYQTEKPGNTLLDIHFLGRDRQLLHRGLFCSGQRIHERVPDGCIAIHLGLRVKGPGSCLVVRLQYGLIIEIPATILPVATHFIECTEAILPDVLNHCPEDCEIFVRSSDLDFRYGISRNIDLVYGGDLVAAALARGRQCLGAPVEP